MRIAATIKVTDQQRKTLQRWARGRSTPVRLMQRAKIVLLAADGKENKEIAQTLAVQPSTVGRWRKRFAQMSRIGLKPASDDRVKTSQCSLSFCTRFPSAMQVHSQRSKSPGPPYRRTQGWIARTGGRAEVRRCGWPDGC